MLSSNLIFIIGPSGSGKSTSLRNMPLEFTRIIDIERKGFPFRDCSRFDQITIPCANLQDVSVALRNIQNDSKCRYIVIESLTRYAQMCLDNARAIKKGFDVWFMYADMVKNFVNSTKNTRGQHIIMTGIDMILSVEESGLDRPVRCWGHQGKELRKDGGIESHFTVVLYTNVAKDKTGKMKYSFITNTDGITTAKSPMDMLDYEMDNDLWQVIQRMESYHSAPATTPAT